VDESIEKFDGEKKEYLLALKKVGETLIAWARICSNTASEFAKTVEEEEYRQNLEKLAKTLQRIPENPPQNFYEAVLTVYFWFATDPDSLGTLDRYLAPFYFADVEKGALTKEEATEYLQELFLMVQIATPHNDKRFTRGGESHFCVGGYLENGEDGFSEFSKLIIEALLDLPTWIPQVTFRWTKKTGRENFYWVMDKERKDPNKRIAFQNDDKRIKCYTEYCGFKYEDAVKYTTLGCNEPSFAGGPAGATSKGNIAKCIETLFHKKSNDIEKAQTFDDFYKLFEQEMTNDLATIIAYDRKFIAKRAEDFNYLSALLFKGCVKKGLSPTQGASDTVVSSPILMGAITAIDSLIIVKQFVFDEKIVSMSTLIDALQNNWEGYEDLHALIKKKGDFFGNDTPRSNEIAQKFYASIYHFLKDKKNLFGYPILIGDLFGYNQHHVWYGASMEATPDGRKRGDSVSFGLQQTQGRDRDGLTSYLLSIAKADPNGICCGSTVTNVTIEDQLVKNDDNFDKLVSLFETYFMLGGVHFQLTYVSKEDLIKAKETPDEYKNLRVRVSGFSDYFVRLNSDIQDGIIERTQHSK
jgi:formate C-acetyltransferase